MKKKNYEVSVTAFATILIIGAENKDKALEYAIDRVNLGDLQMDEVASHWPPSVTEYLKTNP